MDDIFMEQTLETLAAVFRREIIVPSKVQSMSNEKIERLSVTAIEDRVRLSELCKEDEEKDSGPLFGSRSVGSPSSSKTSDVPSTDTILEERMRLFNSRGPRSRRSKSISVACFSI